MSIQYLLTPYFLDQPEPQLENLASENWIVNRAELPPGEPQLRMSWLHRPLAEAVAASRRNGRVPVALAGDCCATIGVLAGLQRAGLKPLLIWFDAHGDFNTWDTTPSGFLGGMPLAMLAGMGEQTLPRAVGLESLEAGDIILSDGRDLDPGERLLVESSGIAHLHNVTELLQYQLLHRPLYVHFDVDVINPLDAPAMSYAAPGGPRAPELAAVFRRLAATGQIAAVSLSAWNPDLDTDGRSQQVSLELLGVLLEGL